MTEHKPPPTYEEALDTSREWLRRAWSWVEDHDTQNAPCTARDELASLLATVAAEARAAALEEAERAVARSAVDENGAFLTAVEKIRALASGRGTK